MATISENLLAAKASLAAKYAEAAANPAPSYSINGQAVSWTEYRKSLLDEIAAINELLATADGPWEIEA